MKGLVLAGGRSTRMGVDKGSINYHGKAQREYLFELLQEFCQETFYSIRPDQQAALGSGKPYLTDPIPDIGPFSALLAAFQHDPTSSWLVVACDLPLMDRSSLQYLIQERQASAPATAFHKGIGQAPEPLAAIWEPKTGPLLQAFQAAGNYSPRQLLQKVQAHLVVPKNPNVLYNVNRPEEYQQILQIIAQSKNH